MSQRRTMVSVELQRRALVLIRRALVQDLDWKLALALENSIYRYSAGLQHLYARKVRQLTFNLQGNEQLRARLLEGALLPDQLVRLTPHELNPTIRQHFYEQSERSDAFHRWIKEVFLNTEDKPTVFRCHKCHSGKTDSRSSRPFRP